MTDRMKTIAETFARQAGMIKILEQHAHEYGAGTFEDTEYPELEKFAELIVRECINACGSDSGTQQIRQHFGVEP